jgi:diphosphomevalonate decarboxylase
MEVACRERNFAGMAELAMQDSNQFHACCMDSYPPIQYMNDTSFEIVQVVHRWNDLKGCVCAGYTFDAGPNAVLLVMQQHLSELVEVLWKSFGHGGGHDWVKSADPEVQALCARLQGNGEGAIRRVLHTTVGSGPHPVDSETVVFPE